MNARPSVTLIRPPRVLSRTSLNTVPPVAPLTLAYLAGALRANGVRTVSIDGCAAADRCTPLDDLPFVVNGLTADQILASGRQWLDAGRIVIGHANQDPISHVYGQLLDIIRSRRLHMVTLADAFGR